MAATKKPWGGRFTAPTDQRVEQFTGSVEFDRRLYREDIRASIAHAQMLHRIGVLSQEDTEAIVEGLRSIERDIDRGAFAWSASLEDVHMNIETALTERIGDAGKRLHTGRSRNDQVATDLRLYLRTATDNVIANLRALQLVLVDLADREAATIMPGFTHMQVAQPVTFGHHMMAWVAMLARDEERFHDARGRINVMPLGAAALAGTTFAVDRDFTVDALEFGRAADNSLDAVSDRDFALEFAAHAAIAMVHLSRFSEEVVLWSSQQFRFIEMSDSYCTGSSIMPQKKNPDVAELVRGKSARVVGDLTSLLVLMKGQPLAYNRDNQEDKEPLFDCVDTLLECLEIFAGMMSGAGVNRDAMRAAVNDGFSTATDLAEYLVRKGVPFRDAHEVVGRAVRECVDRGCDLPGLGLKRLRELNPAIESDVLEALTPEGSVNARNHPGGTAPSQVRAAVEHARARLRDAV